MFRRHFILATAGVLALGIGSSPSKAQTVQMDAAELEALLSGNTAEGVWDGTPYKSYFAPDGVTVYDPDRGETLMGKWRVNRETGEYESFWDAIGWTSYGVLRTEDGYAWLRNGKAYPFNIVQGRALTE